MKILKRGSRITMLIGLLSTAMSPGCVGPQAPRAEIDAEADSAIRRMCAALDGARAIRFRVHATMDGRSETGQLVQFDRQSDIVIARPDRLYAKTESNQGRWSAWYRGQTLTILDRDSNEYASEAVPARLDKMLDYMAEEHDLCMPMADLLVGETYNSLLAEVEEGSYLGVHSVADKPCHHLLFRQENIDWQVWIDTGPAPVPRKLVITYTQEEDQPQYVATMDDWDLAPKTDDTTFTFAPPADASQIELADLIEE